MGISEDIYWEWVGSCAAPSVSVMRMLQGCVEELQEHILKLEERIDSLEHPKAKTQRAQDDKPCKLCGNGPREPGRVVCLRCWRIKEYGII